ncbi:MAG: DMT family transporter [Steroidobacteraceae bacterium]
MRALNAWLERSSPNLRGAFWVLASALAFTATATLVKFLGADYSAALQTFYRQAAGLLFVLPVIVRDRRAAFHATRPGILIFRAFAGTLALMLAYYTYAVMPLADANALSFTRVLWMVPLAAFVLGERVGPRRILATLAGFIGVLFMVQFSFDMKFGWPVFAALLSAFLFSFTVTGMKVLTRDHSVMTIMVWSATLGFVLSIPGALMAWKWPTGFDLGLFAAMGVMSILSQAFYIRGMSEGEAIVLNPLDYTRLVFALMVGYFVFDETPNPTTMIGAAIVIAATLYITVREQRLPTSIRLTAEKDRDA